MRTSLAVIAALISATGGIPSYIESGGDKSKLPHWLRGHHGGSTKNARYYKKRVEKRRKKAGR